MSESTYTLPPAPRGIVLIVVSSVISLLVIWAVGLRILRNFRLKKFGWDEPLIILATLVQLATAALSIVSVPYGNGRHVYAFPGAQVPHTAFLLPWISQPLATAALLLSKASLGVTLLKLGLGRSFNGIVTAALVLVIVADIWTIVQITSGCGHMSDPDPKPCQITTVAAGSAYFQCGTNILIDVIFFAAPEYFLRKTQLSQRDRRAIRVILGFVFVATVMSVIKLAYLQILLHSRDLTFNSPPVSSASVAESGLSIVAACLPAVRQLRGDYLPRQLKIWLISTSNSSAATGDRSSYWSKKTQKDDEERARNRASCASPSSARNVKIINNMDIYEVDQVGVQLVTYIPKSAVQGPKYGSRVVVSGEAPRSPAVSFSTPISPQSPLLPLTPLPQVRYADSLQGRMSSRYRAITPDSTEDFPQNLSRFGALQNRTMSDKEEITCFPRVTPVAAPEWTATEDLPSSGNPAQEQDHSPTYTSSLTTQSHVAPRSNSVHSTASSRVQLLNTSGSHKILGDNVNVPHNRSTESVGMTEASHPEITYPGAPYYFENNKVRRSARQSLEQQGLPSEDGKGLSKTSAHHSHNSSSTSWLGNTTGRAL